MNEFSERLLSDVSRKDKAHFRPLILIFVPLAAILFQVYIPRYLSFLSYLELPLLITVHFALTRREQVSSLFYGAAIGLLQDSLSNQKIGMYGIVKTLVGYFAASVGMRFDVENPFITFVLGFFFYCFHQFFYWVLSRALLGQLVNFELEQTLIFGLLNAAVALPLFHLLDKLKVTPHS
jgi:rod shape-determining protein MreD